MKRFELSELQKGARIHFIGIGGISMSGLAQLMIKKGFFVTGSDRQKSHITKALEDIGATIHEGHCADYVKDAELVVHTAAVHDDNPELSFAKKSGIRTIDRAELLGAVMKCYKNAIGIAGTHGKTSTTSMLAYALFYADADPTISLGGELDLIGGNFCTGESDIFVTEACEYTNSFLKFFPSIALITNIEEDHLDFFKDLDDIKKSFLSFAQLTKGKGKVIACGDDENVRDTLKNSELDIIYYGIEKTNDIYPKNVLYNNGMPSFDIYFKDKFCCHLQLKVPGEHNIKNTLAAFAVCRELGVDLKLSVCGLEAYEGVHRRFEKKGMYNGALVMDDYAHHPTEIKATLLASKGLLPKKLWCVFQPHTYSRTKSLWNEFLTAFDEADELILTDIFAAREEYDGKTRSDVLAEQIKNRGKNVKYFADFEGVCEYLKQNLEKDDILFTMGAGDVYKIGEMLLEKNS